MSSNAAPLPQAKPGAEPSMEEILASIRRIIADDSVGTKRDEAYVPPPKPAEVPLPPVVEEPDADVLDLAEVAVVEQAALDDLEMIGIEEEVEDDLAGTPVEIDNSAPTVPLMVPPLAPQPLNTVPAMQEHILSKETGGLVASAFASLSRSSAMPAPGRTIEDVVVEMLRPMLGEWMDAHLPAIVERLVKAEIERVSRGG